MLINVELALRIQIILIIHRVCLLNPLPVSLNSQEIGSCGNEFEAKPEYLNLSRSSIDGILERLKKELVVVKLNIVYDSSLEIDFKYGKLESYIRNFVFAAQLIFEQPELYSTAKVNLVVVSLRKSEYTFTPDMSAVKILETFSEGADTNPDADLNVLIVFRNLWERIPNGTSGFRLQKKLGLAYPGSFCGSRRTLVVSGSSIGMAVILAHELAHSFNSRHDGAELFNGEKVKCPPDSFIMSPTNGPEKMHWSTCSVNAMVNHFIQMSTCVFDPNRLSDAKPVKDSFDFKPSSSNVNRLLLPGKDFPLDLQCSTALDSSALSTLTKFSRNGRDVYETCKDHVCILGETEISIGPAPGGSSCKIKSNWLESKNDWGICMNATCITL